MGIRVEAMHSPAQVEQKARDRMLWRRLAAVFLAGLVSGVGLSFVGLANHTVAPALFKWVICAGVGLVSGFTSRQTLRDHTPLLRLLSSVAAVMVSMIFIGWISGGDAGLILHPGARPMADWGGLLQVIVGATSAFLALTAWKRRQPAPAPDLTARSPEVEDGARTAKLPSLNLIERGVAALQAASRSLQSGLAQRAGQVRGDFTRRVRGWKRIWSGTPLSRRLPEWRVSQRLPRGRETRPQGRVRLLGVEEHRCPYCLDIVEHHDPRGVVTCKVCHTRHHADCWAVTGMCQVPHHHR
jgi:hypothetical protein